MAANHVDHIEPHQGERSLFMQSEAPVRQRSRCGANRRT